MQSVMSHTVLSPGMFVRHPSFPDWGVGQVQSRIGDTVTVNFTDAGKKVINATKVLLVMLPDDKA